MRQEDGQGDAHNNQKPCSKPSQVNPCTRIALNKVVWIGTSPSYPIRYWRKYIGRNDEECEEVVEQCSGEDNEQESDGKDLCHSQYEGLDLCSHAHVQRKER